MRGDDSVVTLETAKLLMRFRGHRFHSTPVLRWCRDTLLACPRNGPLIKSAPGRIARGCAARPPLRCGPTPLRGDVQPGAAPGCRTVLFVCRRFELLVSGPVA